jgi:hypothetical protein
VVVVVAEQTKKKEQRQLGVEIRVSNLSSGGNKNYW